MSLFKTQRQGSSTVLSMRSQIHPSLTWQGCVLTRGVGNPLTTSRLILGIQFQDIQQMKTVKVDHVNPHSWEKQRTTIPFQEDKALVVSDHQRCCLSYHTAKADVFFYASERLQELRRLQNSEPQNLIHAVSLRHIVDWISLFIECNVAERPNVIKNEVKDFETLFTRHLTKDPEMGRGSINC